MKKNFILIMCIIAISILLSNVENAFSQSGMKHATGGNNYDGVNDFLGSKNYAPLVIKTNMIECARFTPDGNFHLLGNAFIDSLLTAFAVQANTITAVSLFIDGVSQLSGPVNFGNTIKIDGTNGNNTISSSTGEINLLSTSISNAANIASKTINTDTAFVNILYGSTIFQNGYLE